MIKLTKHGDTAQLHSETTMLESMTFTQKFKVNISRL